MTLTNRLQGVMILKTVVLLVLCCSCSSSLNKSDYVAWVRNEGNGLHQKKIAGNYQYEVQYMPAEYIKLLRCGHRVDRTEWEQDTTRTEAQVFSLKITCVNDSLTRHLKGMDKEVKQERDYYFTYLLGRDIKLRDDQGEREAIFSHLETGRKEYQLAFEGEGTGEVALVIRSSHLYDQPVEIKVRRGAPKLRL